ncbi:hypothetical protein Cgig2_003348 [Carnegiea gigantea]|uniref:TatD related DNase n=1 Tax=Carnegiea gigantea TaxID=171969 RepID=A0A9Q1QAW6_9CARY|nr:hypothetical protein Cgig2_003348 [Carnegiea gigantea]
MALSPLPKLAATLVALLLIITTASSSREMPTSLNEVGYLGTKVIIEDGKILVVKPELELAKPVIKEVSRRVCFQMRLMNPGLHQPCHVCRETMKLFDAHCHLQDPRIFNLAPQLIRSTLDSGVVHFAVNGVSQKDWHLVKQMGDSYPCVVPCFGVHPWYVTERSPDWFTTLRQYFNCTPAAAIGEIGLDKGSRCREIDFNVQVEVFKQQLELARELRRPASVHCVRAFGDLLEVMKAMGPFPYGVILHSFLGSAEMVPEFAKLGSFFSFSGFLMSMKPQKVKKLLKAVPSDRILLETDAPDAVPRCNLNSLFLVEGDPSLPPELKALGENPQSRASYALSNEVKDESKLPKELLNHPANIHNVLNYVASMLEMTNKELAELSYANAIRLFSYEGSKVLQEGLYCVQFYGNLAAFILEKAILILFGCECFTSLLMIGSLCFSCAAAAAGPVLERSLMGMCVKRTTNGATPLDQGLLQTCSGLLTAIEVSFPVVCMVLASKENHVMQTQLVELLFVQGCSELSMFLVKIE